MKSIYLYGISTISNKFIFAWNTQRFWQQINETQWKQINPIFGFIELFWLNKFMTLAISVIIWRTYLLALSHFHLALSHFHLALYAYDIFLLFGHSFLPYRWYWIVLILLQGEFILCFKFPVAPIINSSWWLGMLWQARTPPRTNDGPYVSTCLMPTTLAHVLCPYWDRYAQASVSVRRMTMLRAFRLQFSSTSAALLCQKLEPAPESRNSASASTVDAFLQWAGNLAGSKETLWMVVLLGHGGGSTQVCPDEDPG